MKEFLLTLLALSLSGSILALLLVVVCQILGRRLPRAFWYYAWLLVLLRLMVPLGYGVQLPQVAQPTIEDTWQEAMGTLSPTQNQQEFPSEGSDAPADLPETRPEPLPGDAVSAINLVNGLFFLWAVGAAGVFFRHLASYLWFARKIRQSLGSPPPEILALFESLRMGHRVELAISSQVDMPMVMGVLRPVVVLPESSPNLGEKGLSEILRHELIHCKRGDVLYKWLVVLVTALHWFNPVVKWLGRRIALDCELSCDQAVLAALPREERIGYGELLLTMAAGRRLPAGITATTLCDEKRQLKTRIQGILNYHKPSKSALCGALTLGLLLICCSCGVLDLVGPPASSTSSSSVLGEGYVENIGHSSVMENDQEAAETGGASMKDVLLGNISFLYWPEGAETPESKVISQVPAIFSPYSDYAVNYEFTVLDLDGDGGAEVVLQTTDVGNDMGGYLVLHQAGDKIYGYPSSWRTFWYLKADGTFMYSSPTGSEEGIVSARFTETGMELDEHIRWQGDQFDLETFRVDGVSVSREVYEDAMTAQKQKADALWLPWNEDNIQKCA